MLAVGTHLELTGTQLKVILCPEFPVDPNMYKDKEMMYLSLSSLRMWEVFGPLLCTTVNIMK